VAKFCQGTTLEHGIVSSEFIKFASALFPHHNFTNDNCIEAASHYVLAYNQAMLDARANGLIDAMFQIETTTPCDIAKLAGLLEDNDETNNHNQKMNAIQYRPNIPKVAQNCKSSSSINNGRMNPAQQVFSSSKHKINVDLVSLKWEDFQGGKHGSNRPNGDRSLERKVRQLVETLGYAAP
jgi:hypothetical protein